MRFQIPMVALLVAAPAIAHGACNARSGSEPLHLVELYTSEGCSSCPPAERWLSTLRASTTFVALEFHVDYFDDLGWRDPFADPRYTARQKRLAKRGTHDQIYTPQVVVDGRPWKTWPKGAPEVSTDSAAPVLNLAVTMVGDNIQAAISTPAGSSGDDRFYVALSQNGLNRAVTAGENHGKRLEHDAVVRDFAGPLAMPQATATLHPPADFDASKSAVVAFVEDERSGDIRQVLRVPLDQCLR